jgi:hypothetical protein
MQLSPVHWPVTPAKYLFTGVQLTILVLINENSVIPAQPISLAALGGIQSAQRNILLQGDRRLPGKIEQGAQVHNRLDTAFAMNEWCKRRTEACDYRNNRNAGEQFQQAVASPTTFHGHVKLLSFLDGYFTV